MFKSKVMLLTAVLIFGVLAIFVRNINLSSKEIALLRGVIGSLFLIAVMVFSKEKISVSALKKRTIKY